MRVRPATCAVRRAEAAPRAARAEAEQKRILVQRPRPELDSNWKVAVQAGKENKGSDRKTIAVAATPPPTLELPGEQKADNGRITLRTPVAGGREENVTLELPRPAIPAAVVQLITRKDTGERPSQTGDVLADEVGGGLVVLSSVTPALAGGIRRSSPGQPYYQVWIKGERLTPRPGRADDFSWPREDPQVDETPRRRRCESLHGSTGSP